MEVMGKFDLCERCDKFCFEPENKEFFLYRIFKKIGGSQVITKIKELGKKHSDRQRGYWFAVIVPMYMDYTGQSKDEAHREIMLALRPVEFHGKDDRIRVEPTSYSGLTTSEAEDLHAEARSWVTEKIGRYVPLPNEAWGEYN
ncbi:hypothetical protein EHQ53_14180 [Leptospira langatensis]|uniref:Uncharacterized protein n=1 Tax=Leptospira langatensis TaxID=2484983 RepID=A0ABY2MDI8_9LEPT|nr:hypothetical protein [Leptospira langatensis]TGL39666.1 hypothetical protein EHQ53_14180 [Leptospira langatensis]